MLSIGRVARILGVSVETLRNWDTSGKLVPTRSAAGRRLYTNDQIESVRETSEPTQIKIHSVNVNEFKRTMVELCKNFTDLDIVDITFRQRDGSSNATIELAGPTFRGCYVIRES